MWMRVQIRKLPKLWVLTLVRPGKEDEVLQFADVELLIETLANAIREMGEG